MRYLLDTNAYIYWTPDQDLLDVDVYDRLNEPDAVLCISAESVRELIVAYNAKGWVRHRTTKTPSDHIIIAHAMTLHMPLISSDTRFPYYRRQGLDLIFNEK